MNRSPNRYVRLRGAPRAAVRVKDRDTVELPQPSVTLLYEPGREHFMTPASRYV
jgi:hypothetical protein